MALDIIANQWNAKVQTDDLTPQFAGNPTMCSFKVVIRLNGHVSVPVVGQIPVTIQIDAFDVVLHSKLDTAQKANDAMLCNTRRV